MRRPLRVAPWFVGICVLASLPLPSRAGAFGTLPSSTTCNGKFYQGSSHPTSGMYTSTSTQGTCSQVRIRRVYFNSSTGQYSYGPYNYGFSHWKLIATDGAVGATHGAYDDPPGIWIVRST